ncbi:glycosyltransferase family 2 protein [Niameybacter massiliensis]|uniref:glycosyltransferase family 2 protein n=1 Tax=Niameybacter massiliensis TaxID=1658108 RepID=UPI0006B494B5|nr:glycosyltransferase family 2 protein [Niameybacter massiliensis]
MLISVVIPIYNVEPYLKRCIDSVIQQTYSNVEIWLVNDGSIDRCGQIADQYAKKDCRIHVIHKVNGGLSDARNVGMASATGEYLFFLDSDDWIVPDALESLYGTIQKEDADLVVGGLYYAYEDKISQEFRMKEENMAFEVLDHFQAMEALVCCESIKNFAWGKLYKRSLIQDIKFPKGKLFEDIFWQHQVFSRVHKCVVLAKPIVYYFQRPESIVGTFKAKNLDRLEGLHERYKFISHNYPELALGMQQQFLGACVESLVLLFLYKKQINNKKYRREICKYINTNYQELQKCCEGNQTLKTYLRCIHIHYYCLIGYRVVQKLKRMLLSHGDGKELCS